MTIPREGGRSSFGAVNAGALPTPTPLVLLLVDEASILLPLLTIRPVPFADISWYARFSLLMLPSP